LRYRDLEFWADPDKAVYRPQFTLQELRAMQNVEVFDALLAQRVLSADSGKDADCRTLECLSLPDGERVHLRARRVLLGAGTLNTTRIALRSLDVYGTDVPLLSNPYTYYPC